MEKLDDRFSEEAKMLARLAPKASVAAVRAAWARGLPVTVLEDGKIVSIAPDDAIRFRAVDAINAYSGALQGQARRLRRRANLIYCRSNRHRFARK